MTFSPKAAADACIIKSRILLDLASEPLPIADVSDDICRYALLTAVAAIDTYYALVGIQSAFGSAPSR